MKFRALVIWAPPAPSLEQQTDTFYLLQLGHQAANCTTGTINWKSIYGDDAFRLKIPLYESDYVRIKKEKEIDFKALEARAREYAKVLRLPDPSNLNVPIYFHLSNPALLKPAPLPHQLRSMHDQQTDV